MYNVQIVDHGKVKHILGVVDFRFIGHYCYLYIKKAGVCDKMEIDLLEIDDIVISLDVQYYEDKSI